MNSAVFVHGFMGGSRQWAGQTASLKDDFDVISVDLPGFGENAHLTAPDCIGGYSQWVLSEMSTRGVDRFHLIGHSMGGMVAQEMVSQAPDRIDKLVLYGTGAAGVLPGRFETIDLSKRRAQSEGPRATARRISATWFLDGKDAEGYEACAAIAEQSSLQSILAGLDAMQTWNGTARLRDIASKTLVVWGDSDRTYQWSQTETLWQTIKDARLSVIPNCAHAVHLEKPGLFDWVLGDFLMER